MTASTKRTRPIGAYVGSEETFQRSAIAAVRLILTEANIVPECAMHVPNGGKRDVVTASKMKAAGVVRGYPDIMIFCRGGDNNCGLAIELKVWPNSITVDQAQIHGILYAAGWWTTTCYTLDGVIAHTRRHLNLK